MTAFRTLDDLGDVRGKVALLRVDLNLPMQDGHVTDVTRVTAAIMPSATRPCLSSASIASIASPHTSGSTFVAIASSATISARCSRIEW